MIYLYTAAEENRLADAAMAEARRLRGLAAAEFWSATARWVCSAAARLASGFRRASSGEVIERGVAPLKRRAGRVQ
jgi:hypothetical protein